VRNLIITGTSGFLGKELALYFAQSKNIRVWSAGRSSEPASISTVVRSNSLVDIGVILSGWSGVFSAQKNDSEAQQISLENFRQQVLETVDVGASLVVGFGSQAEYDLQDNYSSYAQAKSFARSFLLEQSAKNGLNAHWLRVFSVYGPGMDPRWILPKFIETAMCNRVFEVGPCNQKWGFLHISDFCRAISFLLERSSEAPFDIDVGAPASQTLREILLSAESSMKWDNLKFDDLPSLARDSVPNLKTLSEFGWVPEVSFLRGFRDLVEHYAKSS
jgi:nucleoside-diphosphate-sugar epimerase